MAKLILAHKQFFEIFNNNMKNWNDMLFSYAMKKVCKLSVLCDLSHWYTRLKYKNSFIFIFANFASNYVITTSNQILFLLSSLRFFHVIYIVRKDIRILLIIMQSFADNIFEYFNYATEEIKNWIVHCLFS